jgi:hypothetical protein
LLGFNHTSRAHAPYLHPCRQHRGWLKDKSIAEVINSRSQYRDLHLNTQTSSYFYWHPLYLVKMIEQPHHRGISKK